MPFANDNNDPDVDTPEIEKVHVLEAMRTHGGGFASALATAWMRADSANASALRAAFPQLYARYEEVARRQLAKEVGT